MGLHCKLEFAAGCLLEQDDRQEQSRCRDEKGMEATGREVDVWSGGTIRSFPSDLSGSPQQSFHLDFG